MTLPRKSRLSDKNDFEMVFKQGKTVKSSFFFIKFLKNSFNYPRIAISLPIKISKKATQRNIIKRKISAAASDLIDDYKNKSLDLIIVATPTILGKSSEEIKSVLEKNIKEIFVNDK